LERFRSEHPHIAAIRIRDAQGHLIGQSGVALRSNTPVGLGSGAVQVSTIQTASGELVLSAFRVQLVFAAGAPALLHTRLTAESAGLAETAIIEIGSTLEAAPAIHTRQLPLA
jgi:hypothetical protein